MVLVISQLCQLLHRAICFVALQNDCVQNLSHYEKVVDFFSQSVFDRKVIQNIELPALCGRDHILLGASLALRPRLKQHELLIQLLLDCLKLSQQEALFLRNILGGAKVINRQAALVWIPLKVGRITVL